MAWRYERNSDPLETMALKIVLYESYKTVVKKFFGSGVSSQLTQRLLINYKNLALA